MATSFQGKSVSGVPAEEAPFLPEGIVSKERVSQVETILRGV